MDFATITSGDAWFKKHPEKIAGIEVESSHYMFPIVVKGTKEDVLRVTGMNDDDDDDIDLLIQIAEAEAEAAKAQLILL